MRVKLLRNFAAALQHGGASPHFNTAGRRRTLTRRGVAALQHGGASPIACSVKRNPTPPEA